MKGFEKYTRSTVFLKKNEMAEIYNLAILKVKKEKQEGHQIHETV